MEQTLGERIKIRRKKIGITQEQLANIIKATKSTISKYENGEITKVPSDRIEALAYALKTTPSYLMGWEDEATTEIKTKINSIFSNPNVQVLFDTAKKVTMEELDFVYNLMQDINQEKKE